MKNFLKIAMMCVMALSPLVVLADVTIHFDNNNATTTPGSAVILSGTLTNSSTTPVYLKSIINLWVIPTNFSSSSSLFVNSASDAPASFAFLPSVLNPGQPYVGKLALLNISATTTPGEYWGGYNLFGSYNSQATSTALAFQNFYIHVLAGATSGIIATSSTSTSVGLQMPTGLQFQDPGLAIPSSPYPDGPRLIKLEGSSVVYWVSPNNIKLPMWTDAVFKSYKNNPSDVQIVGQDEFGYYQDAKFVRLIGSAKIYKIEGRTKFPISSSVWNSSGTDASQIIDINKTDFNSYKTGKSVLSADQL